MKLLLAADHGGFQLKQELVSWASNQGYEVVDMGAHELDPNDDYPGFAAAVAQVIAAEASDFNQQTIFGVLICRSAGGVTIAANRFKGVRAVAAGDAVVAVHARTDNAANVVGLSGDRLTVTQAIEIITAFCTTQFSNEERHVRRLQQIESFAGQQS